jgi:hypothetical protein
MEKTEKTEKIPVFVWKKNRDQVGGGYYEMVACFVTLGVHVSFTVYSHSENDYLRGKPEASLCDGSCRHAQGHMDDYSKEGHHTDHARRPIVDAAMVFKK